MSIRRTFVGVLVMGVVSTAAFSLRAAPKRDRQSKGEEVTLTGRLVDLQSFMTGRHSGGDPKKSAQQAIRSGVPTAIETDDGVVVIGMGERGPARLLSPLALQHVELKGRLYEKDGLTYLDLITAKAAKGEHDEQEADHTEAIEPTEHAEDQPDEEHPEEEPVEEEP